MLAGSAVVYAVGVPWLAAVLDVSAVKAMELGLVPFVVGDAIKLMIAGASAPLAWRLLGRRGNGF